VSARQDPATERAARDAAIVEARHRVVRGIRRWGWLMILLAVVFLAAVWLVDTNLGNPFSVTGA
jgi:hypothetical protein